MEPTSPLNIFAAVFDEMKRIPIVGRILVTLTSLLMIAALDIFAISYLVSILAPFAKWTYLAVSTKSLPSLALPHLAQAWEHVLLAILVFGWGLSAFLNAMAKRELTKGLARVEEKMNDALEMSTQATEMAQRLTGVSKSLTELAKRGQ